MSAGSIEQIREHMEVVGSDGRKVGTVDRVEAGQIKLTRNDSPDGQHHLIQSSLVGSVDDKVHLIRPAHEVQTTWQTA